MDANDILALADVRRGHFRLESGLHTAQWLDVEPLFIEPARIRPFTSALARLLAPFAPQAICGPLVGGALVAQLVANELSCEMYFTERVAAPETASLFAARYRLPSSLARRAAGKRVAIVDDAISAGSSVRATYESLGASGVTTVAVGALLLMGDGAVSWFAEHGIPLVSCASVPLPIWTPDACPLCTANTVMDDPAEARPSPTGLTPG